MLKWVFQCVLMWLAVVASCGLCGQQQPYTLQHFSTEDGLSDHRINTVLMHSNGMVYVATWNGLNRFDGHRFTPVPLSPRPDNRRHTVGRFVYRLWETRQGMIVAIVDDKIENDTLQADLIHPGTGEVEAGYVLKRTLDQEQLQFKSSLLDVLPHPVYPITPTTYLDQEGNQIRLPSDVDSTCVITWTDGTQTDLTADWSNFTNVRPSPFGPDFKHHCYFRSYNGLLRLDLDPRRFSLMCSDPSTTWEYRQSARAAAELNDSTLLLSTETNSVYVHRTPTHGPPSTSVLDVGLPPGKSLRGIYPLEDEIVLTGYFGELVHLSTDLEVTHTSPYTGDRMVRFMATAPASDSTIFLGEEVNESSTRLTCYHPASRSFTQYPNINRALEMVVRITAMAPAPLGHLWIGTTDGLLLVDPAQDQVLATYTDAEHRVIETAGVPDYPILISSRILSVHHEGDQTFVGTEGEGLQVLQDHKLVAHYTTDNGLPNNVVCTITRWFSGLWLGTYNGLCYFDRQEGPRKNFSTADGMPHNECNRFAQLKLNSGEMVIGGMNGFMRFWPEELLGGVNVPRLLFSGAETFDPNLGAAVESDQLAMAEAPIPISSTNRACAFRFALSDHWRSESIQYLYQLQPAGDAPKESAWINNGSDPTVQFSYLEAGEHDLLVKAVAANGNVTPVKKLELHVAEVFWKTGWFVALVLGFFAGLFYLVYRYRLQQAIRIERLRTRLSSDLHDDVGSVLSGVAYQMELLEMTVDEAHRPQVKQVAQSSRKAMWQMRDVVWAINARNSSVGDLELRMQEFAQEMLAPLGIGAQFELDPELSDKILSSETRHSLLLIYKEFVTNSIKHSGADLLRVTLGKAGKRLKLVVRDNGQGLQNPDAAHTGQGLSNMALRTDKLGGTLSFLHDGGFGVDIEVPLS